MSHMVIYRGPDGSPGYHQTDEVHDAVAFVEQLRNDKGVEEARIFRMEQVNFEYRPYFRVELTASEPSLGAGASKPAVEAASSSLSTDAAPVEVKEAEAPAAPAITVPGSSSTPGPSSAPGPSTPGVSTPGSEPNGDVGARRGLFGR